VLLAGLVAGRLLTAGGSDPQADDKPSLSQSSGTSSDAASAAPAHSADPSGAASASPTPPDDVPVPYVVLSPGECFDHPALSSNIGEVERRSCSGPHDAEAISNATLTGSYDSETQMQKKVLELCEDASNKRMKSLPADGTTYYTYVVYPTQATYELTGEDEITCALTQSGSIDGKKMTKPLPK
jgi:hypothetical protein